MDRKIKIKIFVLTLMEIAFFSLGAWLFWQNNILKGNILDEQKKNHELELKLASYEKIKEEYLRLGDEGDLLSQKFTSQNDAVYFIRDIEQAAKDTGVELQTGIYKEPASPAGKKKSGDDANQLKLLLTTRGSFSNFVKFLVKLENINKYLEVKKIDISNEKVRVNDPAGAGGTVLTNVLQEQVVVYAQQ